MSRKISGFLVKGRYLFLALMLALAAVCAVLSRKVSVISDLSGFLPDDSPVKEGERILAEEFDAFSAASPIRLMGKGLSEDEKQALWKELNRLDYVKSVEYEYDSEDYNKDNYSLFVVNSDFDRSTGERKMLEKMIEMHICPRYDLVFEKEDGERNAQLWLAMLAAAILLLTGILCILSRSWVLPILFLFTAGISILINGGTNAYLDGVSDMTGSIAPILQLILSIHYSVILTNRYRQEQSRGKENVLAMADALRASAAPIVSGSLITAAGLLALAGVSSKPGTEAGIVLAKGVLISMICIFTILPALILLCQKIIKKPARIHLFFPILLLLLFTAATLMRGDKRLLNVMPKSSEIEDLFPRKNTIIVLYDTDDEANLKTVAEKLEKEAAVHSVKAYSVTLGRAYTAADMTDKLTEMSENIKMEPWMLPFLYFDYGGYETPPLLLGEFLDFLGDFAAENPAFLTGWDSNLTKSLDMLAIFADKDELARTRTAAETASLLGIDKTLAEKLFQVSGRERMGLAEFLQAVEDYSGASASVSPELMEQIEMASLFTDRDEYTKQRTTKELAQLFGVEESLLSKLLLLKGRKTVSIEELIGMISPGSWIYSMLPQDITEKLYLVDLLTDREEMEKKRTAGEISDLLGIDRSLLAVMGDESMSLAELMQLTRNMSAMPDMTSVSGSDSLARIRQIMADTEKGRTYAPAEIEELFAGMADGMDESRIALIYKIYYSGSAQSTDALSLEQLFAHILDMTKKEEYAGLFDDRTKSAIAKEARKLAEEKRQLVGRKYSVMILTTFLPQESEEIDALLDKLDRRLKRSLDGRYYLLGEAPKQRETAENFSAEAKRIPIVTAASVFAGAMVNFGILYLFLLRDRRKAPNLF